MVGVRHILCSRVAIAGFCSLSGARGRNRGAVKACKSPESDGYDVSCTTVSGFYQTIRVGGSTRTFEEAVAPLGR